MAPKPPKPLKEPAEKLSLAVRKNVRDEWESKKPETEERISKALGTSWTVATNPNLLYVYTDNESYQSRIGSVITWYMEPFCDNLESFVSTYGDDGKAELNSLCTEHRVELVPQQETQFTYGGLQIKDGVLRLIFAEGKFATNVSEVSRNFPDAIKEAAASSSGGGTDAYNILARNSVRQNYEPAIEDVQEAIGELVGIADIALNPNFEANAAALAKAGSKARDDWDTSLGQATLSYFEGLKGSLESAGFKADDMLQEGFQEGVSKKEILLRVTEKLATGATYHEILIEDGVLVIQVLPGKWWVNVSEVGAKILDVL